MTEGKRWDSSLAGEPKGNAAQKAPLKGELAAKAT